MQPTSNNKRNAASRKRVHTKSLVQSTSILAQLADATPPPPEPPFQTLPEMPPDDVPEPAQELTTDLFFHEYSPRAAEPTADVPLVHTEPSPPQVPAPQKPPPPLGSSSMNDDLQANVHPSVDPGHVRSPVLAREPTTLESFSRMVRNYMPSSIPIPSVAPTPPRVSRPVSFGSFLNPAGMTAQVPDRGPNPVDPNDRKRRGSDLHNPLSWSPQRDDDEHQAVFDLDEELRESSRNRHLSLSRYPGFSDGDEIIWSGWDSLSDTESSTSRRLLLIGYRTGLQIWDCSSLGSVSEFLNLTGPQWGAIELARILPSPRASDTDDHFAQYRPLIGLISRDTECRFLVYSLRTHEVVHRISIHSLISFAASNEFIVLSTAQPDPSLRILSSRTFKCCHTLHSSSLVTFARPSSRTNAPASPDRRHEEYNSIPPRYALAEDARPIFALSGRFLAYCSSPPRPDAPISPASRYPQTGTRTSMAESGLKRGIGMTQAELGHAAVKIGGSVLSGMKSLGGLAFSAAKAGVSAAVSGEFGAGGGYTNSSAVGASASGRLFSRSAPEATTAPTTVSGGSGRELPEGRVLGEGGSISSPGWEPTSRVSAPSVPLRSSSSTSPSTSTSASSNPLIESSSVPENYGSYVTVLDLGPLGFTARSGYGRQSPVPGVVAEFLVSKYQAVCDLVFSKDGVGLVISPKDGQDVRVFQVRPVPRALREVQSGMGGKEGGGGSGSSSGSGHGGGHSAAVGGGGGKVGTGKGRGEGNVNSPWHMYDLHRGRTSGVIQQVECAQDGRWVGVGTKKGTIHVFAVNPYGGPPDERSHLEGRVVNMSQLPLSTIVSPITRIRTFKQQSAEQRSSSAASVTFTFAQSPLPSSLLPPSTPTSFSGPSSLHSTHSPTAPTRRLPSDQTVTNYQDILVFTPGDGVLTLHRVFVEAERRSQDHTPSTSTPSAASGSLPGGGGLSSMTTRFTSGGGVSTSPKKASGLSRTMGESGSGILVAHESVVATWMLRRGRGWKEVRRSVGVREEARRRSGSRDRGGKSSYLAQAELSTFTRSPGVLPRSIYLTHQFGFHTFGEDYHALLRSHRFDLPITKVEVRKEVEISAFASTTGSNNTNNNTEEFDNVQSSSHGGGIPRSGQGQGPGTRNSFISTSFDEGLASAISAQMPHSSPSPPIIPMFPNGTPGSSSSAARSIPIRSRVIPIRSKVVGSIGMGDGIFSTEGLGRLKREIVGKVRSPRLGPMGKGEAQGMGIPIPLEFEEEDEDFVVGGNGGINLSGAVGGEEEVNMMASPPLSSNPSGSTDTSSSLPLPSDVVHPHEQVGHEEKDDKDREEDLLQGWDVEGDMQAVEDREPFYDISAAGFMDEERI